MLYKTIALLCLIGFLMVVGCREIVPNEYSNFEQKTTVNSLFAADSLLQVHLSTTNKMNHEPLNIIDDAEVNLFTGGEFLQMLDYTSNGLYESSQILEPHQNYHCEVQLSTGEIVQANCFMPQSAVLERVSINSNAWINSDGILSPAITFQIKNDTSLAAYYQARVKVFSSWGGGGTIDNYDYNEWFSLVLFSNEFEMDSLITKTIEFQPNSGGSNKQYAYILELRTVSHPYYQYVESLELYEKGRFPEFNTGTIVPYNLYSNVENGYGIFAAYATTFSELLRVQ